MTVAQHVPARTFHGRDGEGVRNAFAYGIDYVLIEPEAGAPLPWPVARNRRGIVSLHDSDHGGAPGAGRGVAWVREVLAEHEIGRAADGRILLLAQPRVLGHVFNPVSFWLCHDGDDVLRVVVAEVTNTYGDRHSYLCHAANFAPIERDVTLEARKIFHVSPFQPVEGTYRFRFDVGAGEIGIWIEYLSERGRLIATLCGPRRPLTTRGMLAALLRRPFGSRRVLGLIHWQALKLWWKGAAFRSRPEPPASEVSR